MTINLLCTRRQHNSLESSHSVPPGELPAVPPLGRLAVVSGVAEGWMLETSGDESEVCWDESEVCSEVDLLELLLVEELVTCGSTLAGVVGTTVGSSKMKKAFMFLKL